jgi:hypothetical protein
MSAMHVFTSHDHTMLTVAIDAHEDYDGSALEFLNPDRAAAMLERMKADNGVTEWPKTKTQMIRLLEAFLEGPGVVGLIFARGTQNPREVSEQQSGF